jgi:diguanylate cyclase (GGDEF)-like protein
LNEKPTERFDSEQTLLLSSFVNKLGGTHGYLVRIYPVVLGEAIVTLPNSKVVIGREGDCGLALSDKDVSRRHAAIEPCPVGYMVTDMGSTNGTLVNDVRIDKQVLKSGDYIRVGKTILKFLLGNDIERQYHETVYSMMINDGLTGIPNKRFLTDALQRELTRSQRHKRPLSLVVFDIDHFKKINDKYGHLAGDVVLRSLSTRINATVRKDEVFARYGGEEFVVVLPEASLEEAGKAAERIRVLVESEPVKIEDVVIPVTISVGIAYSSGEESLTSEEPFAAADKKLYAAKAGGRNRVEM